MNFIDLLNTSSINYVIVILHIAATYLFFSRYFALHRINLDTEDFLLGIKNNMKHSKSLVETLSICDDSSGPISSIAKSILSKNSRDENLLHYAADEAAAMEIPRLQKNMRIISTLGQIALFLGLLGTILSLMELFDGGTAATAGFQNMAPIVQKALVTTALGIVSAMIVHLYNAILMERCSHIVLEMEKTSIELINFIVNDPAMVSGINRAVAEGDGRP